MHNNRLIYSVFEDDDENIIPFTPATNEVYENNSKVLEKAEGAKSFFYSQKSSFADLGASAKMVEVLQSIDVNRPSKIQSLSFKTLLEGKNCILAGKRRMYSLHVDPSHAVACR